MSHFRAFSKYALVLTWFTYSGLFSCKMSVDLENKVYKLLRPIPGKNALYLGQQKPFEHIQKCYLAYLTLLIFAYYHANFQKRF